MLDKGMLVRMLLFERTEQVILQLPGYTLQPTTGVLGWRGPQRKLWDACHMFTGQWGKRVVSSLPPTHTEQFLVL